MEARLILVGPPGAGKGTQAVTITEKLGIAHIATGDMFRDSIAQGTELGKLAQSYIDNGNLVPDEVTDRMVRERLSQDDARDGFLLDGYPRTPDQVYALDATLADLGMTLDVVIEITVPSDVIVDRLVQRAAIEGRADDTEEVIRHRIDVYHSDTEPLVRIYQERGQLIQVDGVGGVDEVHERIVDAARRHLSR
ncbi:MAG: adenylate kinase [Actinomycetaceae bacterium]|nr:adenylate kinase [Arcanobacterium sp.]MDD7505730.1 adenylate kinase [Actinomycetaceae bacterium]MDY6143911.1 adenylate kinase [Arcanobacterium sp.]